MTRFLRISTLTALLALGLAALAAAAPRTFVFDKTHSEVGFNVRHFFNKTHGRFEDYDGQIVFDPANITASSVQVTIKDTSIYTANARRDAHLRTQDFFWNEKYPTLTFKSTKVIPGKDDKHFKVAGDLTIRDVTKPVTLDVEYFGMGPVSISGHAMGTQAGFYATTTVNRKDYGIIWNKTLDDGGVMLGDDVDIVLSIAAITPEPPPAQPAAATAPTTKK